MIGKCVAELRIARGLTPEGLAQAAGLTQPAISYIENGHRWPRESTLQKLATALDVPLAALLMAPGSPIPPVPAAVGAA